MQSFRTGRLPILALAFLQVMMSLLPAHAQDLDSSPPVIESRIVEQGFRGENQVFTATVSDDRAVASVVLFYRTDTDAVYQNRRMQELGSTGIYSTTLPTDGETQVIQYYLEAMDEAQNRTLQGFAFDPMERELVARNVPVAQTQTAEEPPAEGMSTGRKILYGVLGLAVVGALASAGGGGGGGSSPEEGVDVTIVVEPLP